MHSVGNINYAILTFIKTVSSHTVKLQKGKFFPSSCLTFSLSWLAFLLVLSQISLFIFFRRPLSLSLFVFNSRFSSLTRLIPFHSLYPFPPNTNTVWNKHAIGNFSTYEINRPLLILGINRPYCVKND